MKSPLETHFTTFPESILNYKPLNLKHRIDKVLQTSQGIFSKGCSYILSYWDTTKPPTCQSASFLIGTEVFWKIIGICSRDRQLITNSMYLDTGLTLYWWPDIVGTNFDRAQSTPNKLSVISPNDRIFTSVCICVYSIRCLWASLVCLFLSFSSYTLLSAVCYMSPYFTKYRLYMIVRFL